MHDHRRSGLMIASKSLKEAVVCFAVKISEIFWGDEKKKYVWMKKC